MSFSILLTTVVALLGGALTALYPAAWVPFYRARVVNGAPAEKIRIGLIVGAAGQAITSAAMALLIAIVILSVVAVADQSTQFWTGIAVVALSLTYFYKHLFGDEGDWERARDLVREVNNPRKKREAVKQFGPFEQTPWQVTRERAFSPNFLVAPLFVAAAGSGVADVGNAVGVVIAYGAGLVAGQLWQIRLVSDGETQPVLEFVAQRFELVSGAALAALGIIITLA